jgi:V-type H+-transporting ATPase subunit d
MQLQQAPGINQLPAAVPQADENLAQFMDFCTYGHMIDNVVLIVTGTLHERDVQELLDKCHPLGMFDSIATLAVAQNMRELFRCAAVAMPHECAGRVCR